MPRLPIFKKLFGSKLPSTLPNESPDHKKPAILSLSKFKTATKARYCTLSTAFHSKTTSTESTGEDVSTVDTDLSLCLPTVDSIVTSLELNFDHQERQAGLQPSVRGPFLNDAARAEPSVADEMLDAYLTSSQAQNLSDEDVQQPRHASELMKIDVQKKGNPDSDGSTATSSGSPVVGHSSSNTSFENSRSGVVSDDNRTTSLSAVQVSDWLPNCLIFVLC